MLETPVQVHLMPVDNILFLIKSTWETVCATYCRLHDQAAFYEYYRRSPTFDIKILGHRQSLYGCSDEDKIKKIEQLSFKCGLI
jgi:hypothetical protein